MLSFWIWVQSRGGQQPVVSAIAAGGNSSAFLTSTPDEFTEQAGPQLYDRYWLHLALMPCLNLHLLQPLL